MESLKRTGKEQKLTAQEKRMWNGPQAYQNLGTREEII